MRSFQKKILLYSGLLSLFFLGIIFTIQLIFYFTTIRDWAEREMRLAGDRLADVAIESGFYSEDFSNALHYKIKTGLISAVILNPDGKIIRFTNDSSEGFSETELKNIVAEHLNRQSSGLSGILKEFFAFYNGKFCFVHVQPVPFSKSGLAQGDIVLLFSTNPVAILPDITINQITCYLIVWLIFLTGIIIFNKKIVTDTRRIIVALENMRNGNYSIRINSTLNEELHTIAAGINDLATTIQYNNAEIKKQNARLELNSSRQEAFAYNASHEFQAPLANIISICEVSLDNNNVTAPKVLKIQLQNIHSEALRLSTAVTNLLTLARIDNGNELSKNIRFSELDLGKLLYKTCERLRIKWQHKNPVFTINSDTNVLCQTESSLAAIIFTNLIDNALKYSETGCAEISVTLKQTNCSTAFIIISDNGPGIAAANLEKIFERHYRITDNNGNVHGNGIGLALTHELVRILGWRISVTSTLGKGTSFILTIPLI